MSYASEVLADNPLFWLPQSETIGTSLANSGSLGGNATVHGALTLGQPSLPGLGPSISYPNATSAFADYPFDPALNLTGDVTYECWFNPNNITNFMALISKGKGSVGGNGYELRMTGSGNLEALSAYATSNATSTGVLTVSGWNHCGFTRAANVYTFYINGLPAGSSSSANGVGANDATLQIGVNCNHQLGTFETPANGLIAEPAVYDHALSSARFAAHYQAGISPGQPQVLVPHSVSAALRS